MTCDIDDLCGLFPVVCLSRSYCCWWYNEVDSRRLFDRLFLIRLFRWLFDLTIRPGVKGATRPGTRGRYGGTPTGTRSEGEDAINVRILDVDSHRKESEGERERREMSQITCFIALQHGGCLNSDCLNAFHRVCARVYARICVCCRT